MSDHKINIELQINCENMPKDTYEVVQFLNGDIQIIAVYHNQPGFFKEEVQSNPETFDPKDHSALFTEEEKANLSQSMRLK